MKVWVSNFLKVFKKSLPHGQQLQGVVMDVQAIRRIGDGLVYASHYLKPSKAEMRERNEKREEIMWQEEVSMANCNVEDLITNGDGYEIRFRLVNIVDYKILKARPQHMATKFGN